MDSPLLQLPELQPPDGKEQIERTFAGYRALLGQMSRPELLSELSRIDALLEQQSRTMLASTIRGASGGLSGWIENLDRLTLRSTEPAPPSSSSPRGRAAQASQTSRPLSPLDLLAGSGRLGPRLAAKLVAASARASGKRARS